MTKNTTMYPNRQKAIETEQAPDEATAVLEDLAPPYDFDVETWRVILRDIARTVGPQG